MHPYKTLAPKHFWRSAVANNNFLDLEQVYTRKFEISKSDRIVTAGSCFAQHIARRLSSSGFSYMDYEPAPPSLPTELHNLYSYGLFSARYANIYTARQLLQLFDRAFDMFVPQEDLWVDNTRYFDPFRPNIEPDGFASDAEFLSARHSHLLSVRRIFEESDVFIFTLGLTEAWLSIADGAVFPMCPGTVRGVYDSSRHIFRNFTFSEILSDLRLVIAKARNINPTLRFLITVSPVPLAATATADHVMVATSYSKSVLRAVAGELASSHDYIDYFPSFELVAATPVRGALYEPDLRNVSPRGVDLVMRHFFDQHGTSLSDSGTMPRAKKAKKRKEKHVDDIICEEGSLERFSS